MEISAKKREREREWNALTTEQYYRYKKRQDSPLIQISSHLLVFHFPALLCLSFLPFTLSQSVNAEAKCLYMAYSSCIKWVCDRFITCCSQGIYRNFNNKQDMLQFLVLEEPYSMHKCWVVYWIFMKYVQRLYCINQIKQQKSEYCDILRHFYPQNKVTIITWVMTGKYMNVFEAFLIQMSVAWINSN